MALTPIAFPKPKQSYFPCKGGLDLVTPSISISPGSAVAAQNYAVEKNGGYRRIDGFCRYDGRSSPMARAGYVVAEVNTTALVKAGDILTGEVSKARGTILRVVSATEILLTRIAGEFTVEHFLIGGVVKCFTRAVPARSDDPRDDAMYFAEAVDELRADIQKVPGGGAVRGVEILNGTVYAFRDDALLYPTESNLYRATPTGWVEVPMPYRVHFSGNAAVTGTGGAVTPAERAIQEGDTIVCGSFRGVAQRVLIREGAVNPVNNTWEEAAKGAIIFSSTGGGTISAGDVLTVNGAVVGRATSQLHQVKRAPGGFVEAVQYNFWGSADKWRTYGIDGKNNGFEFDGSLYVPIETGMEVDAPSHVAVMKGSLFYSFKGSLQRSSPGQPYSWTVVLGAGEIGTGDEITALMPFGGGEQAAAMVVFTLRRTHVLYGATDADLQLQTTVSETGYAPRSIASYGNAILGLTAHGVQGLAGTLNYGNYAFSTMTQLVAPLFAEMRKRGAVPVGATAIAERDEYRLFFDNGFAVSITLIGDQMVGAMPLNYGRKVTSVVTRTHGLNAEMRFFGDEDGYVYQDGVGTSFDGDPIEAWVRLPFFHDKSPTLRKRWVRALLDLAAEGYAEVDIGYDLGHGTQQVASPVPFMETPLTGGDSFWDEMVWDVFKWDAVQTESPSFSLTGTEKNLAFLFYSRSNAFEPHTIQGVMLTYLQRRLER
jgi:hypothetical protein